MRPPRGLLALAVAAAFLPGCASHAVTSTKPPARATAAAGMAGGEPQFAEGARIFTVPAAGGRAVALTGDDAAASGDDHHGDEERQVDNPIWSPAGEQIAFTQTPCEYCPPELFVMNADGSGSRRLNGIRNAFQPTWSADGRRIAVLLPGSGGGIYTFGRDGGHKRRLLTDSAAIEAPSWSPVGDRIAFARQVSATNWDIYAVDARSGRQVRLTRSGAQETTPEYSPDGKRIAFARQLGGGNWAIEITENDGSHARRVTGERISAVEPSWSPHGRRIAFTAQDSRNRSWIAVVDIRTGRRADLTGPELYATQPAWSRDGKTIAFAARERE